ncbi:MAG: AhpC/TSA family protein [Candidatus Marinimicrobia bacterium]|nr:AhpC/TSA family protein [Candidatus Neomarinimicrobiota bacterium]
MKGTISSLLIVLICSACSKKKNTEQIHNERPENKTIVTDTYDNNQMIKLSKGDRAPLFEGVDQNGENINLAELLEKGSAVLIFYRGQWCPFCSKHLSELQDSLQMILDKGVSVIAVSPEKTENIKKTILKTNATFPILYDEGYKIMNAYGVAYKETTENVEKYNTYLKADLENANWDGSNTLPVPATYVIGVDGKIKYVHFNPDYKDRASVSEILKQL